MNDWISLDPHELANAGVLLRDVSQELIDSINRTRSACCVAGLGRHAAPLMGEAETVARQVEAITEVYLRLGIDVLQRTIAAVQSQQLASVVGGVGSVSSAIIGGTTVGGFVLGEASSVSTAVIGGSSVGGFVLGEVSPVSTAVIGGTTVGGFVIDGGSSIGASTIGGGYYHGGGGGMASGIMALAGVAEASRQRQLAILERMRSSGGGGVTSGDLGTQMLTNMNNAAALKTIEENGVKIAASMPTAGYPQAHAADLIDGGGRVRKMETDAFYEKKARGY